VGSEARPIFWFGLFRGARCSIQGRTLPLPVLAKASPKRELGGRVSKSLAVLIGFGNLYFMLASAAKVMADVKKAKTKESRPRRKRVRKERLFMPEATYASRLSSGRRMVAA